MPRCQWCRQESQDATVCDWCKRPLAAGWTPAAAPADRMSFTAAQEDQGGDRLLMFSMLGIVLVVGLAFGVSFFSRKESLPAVAPPAPAIVQPVTTSEAPQVIANNGPVPAPLHPQPEPRVVVPRTYEPAPAYQPPPRAPRDSIIRRTGNRKLDSLRSTDVD
jgi:hypothetical protein